MNLRPLAISPDGAGALDGDDPEVTVSPATWERWNAEAVWCSVEELPEHGRALRVAVAGTVGVLERDGERAIVPAPSAPGWFWTTCGLWSSSPSVPEVDPLEWLDVARAWAEGSEPEGEDLPPALRLRLGEGEETLRDEILLGHEGGWLRGRRYFVDGRSVVSLDEFSMKQLVLDLSLLLALALARD